MYCNTPKFLFRKHEYGFTVFKQPHLPVYLFQASLDAAVLAGDHFAVPVLGGAACHAKIWVTLSHGQVAGTLFSVTLGLTPAAWEAVLA